MVTASAMQELTDFESIFINDTPLIDTRSPGEFGKGSFPSATNLPLMSNEERAEIGICYKVQGQQAAVELGHQRVSGSIKTERVDAWRAFAKQHPDGALFCWRGGLRSKISQEWLLESGVTYPRINGGYKAMRRWLLDQLEAICESRNIIVLAGKTGCAKTRLLNEGNHGAPFPNGVDLEGLANHRGSAFGRRPGGQPTQLNFEIAVAVAFVKASQHQASAILIEDESRLIGRCALPPVLQTAKQAADLVLVDASLDARVDHSFENYILANLNALQESGLDDDIAFQAFADGLMESLERVQKRLGGTRYKALCEAMQDAIVQHKLGSPDAHKAWIRTMLSEYYDPMYNYQIEGRADRVLMRGTEQEVAEFLIHRNSKSATS